MSHTAGAYQAGVERFQKGRMTAEALAQLIDRTIVPQLEAADARLKSLHGVPPEHKPLVADAEEYLRLRSESWRLRAEGLRKAGKVPPREMAKGAVVADASPTSDANWRLRAESQHRSNMATLGKAEGTERASLEALRKIRLPEQTDPPK